MQTLVVCSTFNTKLGKCEIMWNVQVSDIPGVVHMVEYHDMGDSIWIVLERGDHTKVQKIPFTDDPCHQWSH